MSLTKQEIDALVDGTDAADLCNDTGSFLDEQQMATALRRALYLAAGLTAEGKEKPKRVRCWLVCDGDAEFRYVWFHEPTSLDRLDLLNTGCSVTPGWFVPDGEEG